MKQSKQPTPTSHTHSSNVISQLNGVQGPSRVVGILSKNMGEFPAASLPLRDCEPGSAIFGFAKKNIIVMHVIKKEHNSNFDLFNAHQRHDKYKLRQATDSQVLQHK